MKLEIKEFDSGDELNAEGTLQTAENGDEEKWKRKDMKTDKNN
jgi:hypothetical protein